MRQPTFQEVPPMPHNKHHYKILILIIFLAIISILMFTAFSPYKNKITGHSIIESTKEPLLILTNLSPPEFSIKNAKKIEIRARTSGSLTVGDQKNFLNENDVVNIENFQGTININQNSIYLDGKAPEIIINNLPISSHSNKAVRMNGKLSFKSLTVTESSFDMSYNATGQINLNNQKTILNLKNEKLNINDFTGNFEIKNSKLILKGHASSLNIQGQTYISIN